MKQVTSAIRGGRVLSNDVLKLIVGGNRTTENSDVDHAAAAALTAGLHDNHGAAAEGAPSAPAPAAKPAPAPVAHDIKQPSDSKPAAPEKPAIDKQAGPQKADDGARKMPNKMDDDGTRPRLQSAPGALTPKDDGHKGKQAEKAPNKGDDDATRPRAHSAPAAPTTKDDGPKAKDHADTVKAVGKVVSKVVEMAAKQAAKDAGTYDEKKTSDVLAGGTAKMVEVDGKTTTETTVTGQVKTDGKTESYSSSIGSGAGASKNIVVEAGHEKTATQDLGDGKSSATTDKLYAGVSGEGKAKIAFTKAGVDGEASLKVEANVEVRHTETTKNGIVQTTTSAYAQGHAEAGVQAGLHLGYDGLKVGVSASAVASVSAGTSAETQIGDVKATADLKVFAQAMAEAKANMEVTFDPTKGVIKAKGDVGAMVSTGVGIEAKTGLFNAQNGSGVGVGGGVIVGTAGVSIKPDFDIKDGKLDLKLELGGGLGIGGKVNLQIKGDLNKASNLIVASAKMGRISPDALIISGFLGFFS